MTDVLSQNQNRYIQRDLCLAYSELATAIEAIIVHCHKAVVPWGSESCRPREGSTCSSREFFLLPLWVALLKNQEFTPKWYFSGIISNFSSCFFVNSHGTQPIIPFKCKWPWTACSKKRPVPGYTWWTLLALLLDRFFFPTAIRKQYYLQFCSRRSSRLIVINHQPVFHCPRACLHECGGPQAGEVTRLSVG